MLCIHESLCGYANWRFSPILGSSEWGEDMGSGKRFFESDEAYRSRVDREANERTIENLTGSSPRKSFFESDDSYRDRISREANEHTVEKLSGSSPRKGFFESDDSYRDRISREANERTIGSSSGSAPSPGFFESKEDYEIRVRKEANEKIIERATGSAPRKRLFESDHDYRSRIALESREVRADSPASTSQDLSSSSSYPSTSYSDGSRSSPGGCLIAILGVAGILMFLGTMFSSSRDTATRQVPPPTVRTEPQRPPTYQAPRQGSQHTLAPESSANIAPQTRPAPPHFAPSSQTWRLSALLPFSKCHACPSYHYFLFSSRKLFLAPPRPPSRPSRKLRANLSRRSAHLLRGLAR